MKLFAIGHTFCDQSGEPAMSGLLLVSDGAPLDTRGPFTEPNPNPTTLTKRWEKVGSKHGGGRLRHDVWSDRACTVKLFNKKGKLLWAQEFTDEPN